MFEKVLLVLITFLLIPQAIVSLGAIQVADQLSDSVEQAEPYNEYDYD